MKRFVKNSLVVVVMIMSVFAVLPPASASAASCSGQSFIFPRWYDNLCNDNGAIKSPNDAGGKKGSTAEDTASNLTAWLGTIAMNIVKIMMTIVGYVSLGFIIWGGFKYMINGDNSSGTVSARKTILNAVIGLVLSIMSIALINLITGAIV